jgi:hypothetical protein
MSLEQRVKSLEEWRDAVTQACFQAPKKEVQQGTAQSDVILNFPQHLRQHLTVKDNKIFTEYVSREKFMEINEAAKTLGYEYVSGKGAHWEKKH